MFNRRKQENSPQSISEGGRMWQACLDKAEGGRARLQVAKHSFHFVWFSLGKE